MKTVFKYALTVVMLLLLSVFVSAEETSDSNDNNTFSAGIYAVSINEPIYLTKDGKDITLYTTFMMVDLNDDLRMTGADARLILRHSSKIELYTGDIAQIDVSEDGKITATDARLVLRYVAKLDNYYRTSDGYVVSGMFRTADDRLFMLDSYGAASTGIRTIDGCNYYFEKGIAAVGAVKVKGSLWFFGNDGKGVTGTEKVNGVDVYFVDGKSFSGYKNNVYFSEGVPANGTFEIDGITYTFENGISTTGYKTVNGKKIYYVNGAVANGFADVDGSTYYFKDGVITYGWRYAGDGYYHLDRSTGKLAKNTTVDGIRVDKNGKAENSYYNNEKIKTFIKARDIVNSITSPSDTVSEKKLKCFRWVMSFSYRQYRLVGASMKITGWEMLFANDIFVNGSGCCGSTSAAFAFLAVECGCQDVYFCDDGVSTDGHAWVTMEGNNRVYDVVFAKSKGFNSNYDAVASDYRRTPPRKTYIGG